MPALAGFDLGASRRPAGALSLGRPAPAPGARPAARGAAARSGCSTSPRSGSTPPAARGSSRRSRPHRADGGIVVLATHGDVAVRAARSCWSFAPLSRAPSSRSSARDLRQASGAAATALQPLVFFVLAAALFPLGIGACARAAGADRHRRDLGAGAAGGDAQPRPALPGRCRGRLARAAGAVASCRSSSWCSPSPPRTG